MQSVEWQWMHLIQKREMWLISLQGLLQLLELERESLPYPFSSRDSLLSVCVRMRIQRRSLRMRDLLLPLHGRIDQEEDFLLYQLNSNRLETWTKLLDTMRSDTDLLLTTKIPFYSISNYVNHACCNIFILKEIRIIDEKKEHFVVRVELHLNHLVFDVEEWWRELPRELRLEIWILIEILVHNSSNNKMMRSL